MTQNVLKVNAQIARTQTERSTVEVAVGILVNEAGEYLFTSRPEGKVYAGYWEFPGGKVDVGETAPQALARELEEELGVQISEPEFFREQYADYPHALVCLKFYLVRQWSGQLQMREGQNFAWQHVPPQVQPLLPATVPVVGWLEELTN